MGRVTKPSTRPRHARYLQYYPLAKAVPALKTANHGSTANRGRAIIYSHGGRIAAFVYPTSQGCSCTKLPARHIEINKLLEQEGAKAAAGLESPGVFHARSTPVTKHTTCTTQREKDRRQITLGNRRDWLDAGCGYWPTLGA
jgi:hypothetical protein